MNQGSTRSEGQPSIGKAALSGLCPQCGARGLFAGPTRFADHCQVCALDFSRFNVGDGPAAFLTLIIGALITALALWLEISVTPPFWVHVLVWVPMTAGAIVFGLRFSKAALLYSEYTNSAHEAGSDDLREDDE